MKKYFDYSFFCSILAIVFTLGYLIVRIFVGLDFTDEMQYYGQIHGLISSNKLFSTDFFIQQTGYLLIYPFLKFIFIFDPTINFINLILYTRLLLFLFIVAISLLLFFLSSNYRLISRVIGSCLVAISITEYLPFAFSYNTIGFLLSSLILMIWLFFENQHKVYILSFLIVLLGWTYPPLGILFSILILVDCIIYSKRKNFFKIIISLLFISLAFILIIFSLNFFDINTFAKSLIFSGYFDSGFFLLFSNNIYLIFLSLVFIPGILFIYLLFYENKFLIFIRRNYAFIFPVLSLFFLFLGFALIFTKYFWKFSILLWSTSICIMILEKEIEALKKSLLLKILFSCLLISLVHTFTSSNSFTVSYRGFFLTIGFLFLVFSSLSQKNIIKTLYIDFLGVIIVMGILGNILVNPYRDKNNFAILSERESFISYEKLLISNAKFMAINEFKKNVIIEKNKTLLVIGPHPWIYFALNAKPNTPYLFMHFVLSSNKQIKKVENFIIDNLENRNPDYIINTMPNASFFFKNKIKVILENYSCTKFIFPEKLNIVIKKETDYQLPSQIEVCQKIK
jgi:hypothetical protein